ncbi:MAG: hypothetical protein V3T31_12475 [candidate division Zixibacteria bacterium]
MKLSVLILLVASMGFVRCSDDNCDDKMAETRTSNGEPEEVQTYDSGDYHSVSWWYWSQGVNYDFTWGENVDGCEVSRYTFDPIESDSEKAAARESRVLVERITCPDTPRPTQ